LLRSHCSLKMELSQGGTKSRLSFNPMGDYSAGIEHDRPVMVPNDDACVFHCWWFRGKRPGAL